MPAAMAADTAAQLVLAVGVSMGMRAPAPAYALELRAGQGAQKKRAFGISVPCAIPLSCQYLQKRGPARAHPCLRQTAHRAAYCRRSNCPFAPQRTLASKTRDAR